MTATWMRFLSPATGSARELGAGVVEIPPWSYGLCLPRGEEPPGLPGGSAAPARGRSSHRFIGQPSSEAEPHPCVSVGRRLVPEAAAGSSSWRVIGARGDDYREQALVDRARARPGCWRGERRREYDRARPRRRGRLMPTLVWARFSTKWRAAWCALLELERLEPELLALEGRRWSRPFPTTKTLQLVEPIEVITSSVKSGAECRRPPIEVGKIAQIRPRGRRRGLAWSASPLAR